MEKARKPISTRKPPELSQSHAEIEDWLRRVMPDLHPIVERLDATIRETIPGLRYAKVKTLEDADAPEMHTWIEQAGRVPGWI